TGRKRGKLPGFALSLAFLDSEWLASGGPDQCVRVWSVTRGDLETVFNRHADKVWCVTFSPDGRLLASASRDHSFHLWNWRQSRECVFLGRHAQPVIALAYAPDGRTVASGH